MVIAVTNRKLCTDNFVLRVREILSAEPFEVMLREKDLSDDKYCQLAKEIVADNNGYKKVLALNRPEIALELGIENVHLTMQQLMEHGRPSFIKRAGVSVHSAEEAETATGRAGVSCGNWALIILLPDIFMQPIVKKVFLPEELNFSGVYVKVLIFLFLR